eukprot:7175249-Pyramimonas_sp.AAC.1
MTDQSDAGRAGIFSRRTNRKRANELAANGCECVAPVRAAVSLNVRPTALSPSEAAALRRSTADTIWRSRPTGDRELLQDRLLEGSYPVL